MTSHPEWNCKFNIEEVMNMIVNFWNTQEGKLHTAQLNSFSFRAVQTGITKMTNNVIDIETIAGTINGYCHSPAGALMNYIYSLTSVQRRAIPTENYMRHARNKFGLNISLETAETIIYENGCKIIGTTLMNGVKGVDGEIYLVNNVQKINAKPNAKPNANVMQQGSNVPKKFVDKYTENNPNISLDGIWELHM